MTHPPHVKKKWLKMPLLARAYGRRHACCISSPDSAIETFQCSHTRMLTYSMVRMTLASVPERTMARRSIPKPSLCDSHTKSTGPTCKQRHLAHHCLINTSRKNAALLQEAETTSQTETCHPVARVPVLEVGSVHPTTINRGRAQKSSHVTPSELVSARY